MGTEPVPPEAEAEVARAVRRALAEHGYARLTTANIAAESEMSEAGLYYHYDSKDEMIAAFLRSAVDHLLADLDDVESDDPEAKLRAACERLFVDRADETARGVNVAVMELLSHAPYNETLRQPLLDLERHTIDYLAGFVEDGIESGVFRGVDPRGTAALLVAAANGSTGFYLALGMEEDGQRLHDKVDSYLDSLLADD
jgi:AcrR family transcriptional regulator